MKLQPASQKELARIGVGTLLCTAAMLVVFALLGFAGLVKFDYTVWLGALGGAVVAILNFAILCLTVQKVAAMADDPNQRARVQLSYNGRLMFQAAWCVIAYLAPCFQVFAAVLPLLFPRIVIYILQVTGKYKPQPAAAQAPADPEAPAAPEDEAENTPEEGE